MTWNPKPRSGLIVGAAIAFLGFALVYSGYGSNPVANEAQTAVTLQAAMKTKTILDRAVEVYGGKDFLESINNVELVVPGTYYSMFRSHSPDERRALKATRTVAFQKQENNYRIGNEIHDGSYTGTLSSSNSYWANLVTEDEAHLVFPLMKGTTRGFALPGIQNSGESFVPHLVLANLVENRRKLTWLGQETFEGETQDLIAFPEGGLGGYTVFAFAQSNGALVAMQRPSWDPVVGDVVLRIRFGGYYEKDGTIHPRTYAQWLGEILLGGGPYETFDLDAELDPGRFLPPPEFPVYDNPTNPSAEIVELADRVYLINTAGTLIVEFDDHIVIAGASGFNLDITMDLIRETIPEKPIRYIIPLDHHSPQSRSVRAYVAEGANVITPSNNLGFYEKLVRTHPVMNPDKLALEPREPEFEIVDERREFADGRVRMVLVNVGPIAHAKDIYVAYLPELKMALTADMFRFNPDALPMAVADEHMGLLIENLGALKGAGFEVETLLNGRRGQWALPVSEVEKLVVEESGG